MQLQRISILVFNTSDILMNNSTSRKWASLNRASPLSSSNSRIDHNHLFSATKKDIVGAEEHTAVEHTAAFELTNHFTLMRNAWDT